MLQSFPLVRLAALDLDGTLLNRNNEVTLATRQAIARAVEHGVVVVPATGRPLASLPPVVAKLPGIRYAITSNGAAVWDLGDDPMGAVHSRYANAAQRHTSEPACLLHRLMPTEVAREAFDLFQQYDGELSVFSDGLAAEPDRRPLYRHSRHRELDVPPCARDRKTVHVLRQHRKDRRCPAKVSGYPGRGRGAGFAG